MKQTARQTEAYDLAKGTLGREGEVGRLPSQAQCIVPTILKCSTAARGTLACTTSTIAHVNATHPRPELDVVSVLFCLRTYHLCGEGDTRYLAHTKKESGAHLSLYRQKGFVENKSGYTPPTNVTPHI